MTKRFPCLFSVLAGTLAVVLLGLLIEPLECRYHVHYRSKSVCQSLTTAKLMFSIGPKIYLKIAAGKMISYNVLTKEHTDENVNVITKDNDFTDIENVCHFDLMDRCSEGVSNLEFCKNSDVYSDMVAITGIGNSVERLKFYRMSEKGKLHQYQTSKYEAHDNSLILPSASHRLYASLFMLFKLIMSNHHLRFTGLTYNQHNDCFYMMATLMNDNVARSDTWGQGKHVLLMSNFSMVGLFHDSMVVHQFAEEMAGLVDYNGNLYALTKHGDKVIEIDETGKEIHNYDLKSFFACGVEDTSPFTQPIRPSTPHRSSLKDLGISRLNSLAFPYFPDKVHVVESSMLVGFNFVAIITVLVVLLILIVIVDGFIIYNMSKADVPPPGGPGSKQSYVGSGSRISVHGSKSKSNKSKVGSVNSSRLYPDLSRKS